MQKELIKFIKNLIIKQNISIEDEDKFKNNDNFLDEFLNEKGFIYIHIYNILYKTK